LEALARQHPQVKLRIVDIGSWSSAVARQHAIRSLPTLWLYEDGELFSKDRREIGDKLSSLR
jgi:hypothetical protein